MVFIFKKENFFIKRKNREIKFEDILIDDIFQKKEGRKENKIEFPLRRGVFFLILFIGIVLISSFLIYCAFLQIVKGDYYENLAEKNRYKILEFSAERGIIFDRNLTPLVKNEIIFDLVFHPQINISKEDEKNFQEISNFLHLDVKKIILKNINEPEIIIKKKLTHEELIFFQTRIDDFKNFSIQKRIIRNYVDLSSLSHILGYIGQDKNIYDLTGKEGVEKTYNDILKEQKGEIKIDRNAKGEILSKKIESLPKSGENLVLTIDFNLQKIVQEKLKQALRDSREKSGAVIILNPKTGEVLASVSEPSFDNNLFSKGLDKESLEKLNKDPLHPQLNRVISGLYPTGSTIKPFIAVAALEEKIITPQEKIYCPLNLCIKNIFGKKECFVDWKFHGQTDIKRAIAESVNTFFYIIGGGYKVSEYSDPLLQKNFQGLGVQKIKEYLEKFGFGQKTNIDLAGEAEGRIPSPEWKKSYFKNPQNQIWLLGDTYNLSIGQGFLLATPIQLAQGVAAITNNGKIVKPHVAKGILKENGKIEEFKTEITKENIISKETLEVVKEGMLQTVQSPAGSAYRLSSLPIKVAAKTGTAQVISSKDIYQNWIVLFAPYENPQIVMVVLIENVQGLKATAQILAKEILEWYFAK